MFACSYYNIVLRDERYGSTTPDDIQPREASQVFDTAAG
jgi:hypothetical protein